MILEGIVTTQSAAGEINIAPMGPRVNADMTRFLLRPFNTSTTYRNLREHGEGVLHVTDDTLLLARAALGRLDPLPPLIPARSVRGWVLPGACRCYEFRVLSIDDRTERVSIEVEVVDSQTFRDFFGFNRAKHAIVEAAILATRVHLLPRAEIDVEFAKLAVIVQKTAGEQERLAFDFLRTQVGLIRESEGPIRIRTASRLHFGLLSLPGCDHASPQRMFGGIGMMVDRPGVEVLVHKSERFTAEGPLADRAAQFAERCAASLGLSHAVHVQVVHAPPDHVGLGVGTQLGLAVARGIAELTGQKPDAVALAKLVGRGLRSAIGVHGFDGGGFLVEGGKVSESDISPLVGRWDFPDDWRVLLILPKHLTGAHGLHELGAFADLQRQSPLPLATDAMSRLILLAMIPALLERNLNVFSDAMYEYNRKAGEMFRDPQGGIYADPWITHAVETLRDLGVRGVGQSSWGPAVFAIVHQTDAEPLAARFAERVEHREIIVARGCNHGAIVLRASSVVSSP